MVSSSTEPNFTEVHEQICAGIKGATCMKGEMIETKAFLEHARAMTMECSKKKPKNQIRPCYNGVISVMRNKNKDLDKQIIEIQCENQIFASQRKDISTWLKLSNKDIIMALINFASMDSQKPVINNRPDDVEGNDVNIII